MRTHFRRLSPEKLQEAKQTFLRMEEMGLCQKASSRWAYPFHLAKKDDGTLRPCNDYHHLNMITKLDRYLLPNMADMTSISMALKISASWKYYQVLVYTVDIPKTSIFTPFDTYAFNYSCISLKNLGATCQRLMEGIPEDLALHVCYVDDILIFFLQLARPPTPLKNRARTTKRQWP